MAGDLVAARAAFQRAIDAQPEMDGTYKYEVIRWTPPQAPLTGGFGIAIVDEGGYISSSTIYRDRVLGHYTLVGDHFKAIEPEISLPSPVASLMRDTLAANPEYASSVDTADLAMQFALKYNKLFPVEYSRTHGDLTFNALAELNPSAYFLIFHLDGSFNNDGNGDVNPSYEQLACSLREPEGPAKLHAFYRTLGKSIADIIGEARAKGVDIRFVNLAAGLDPVDSQNLIRNVCPELQFTTDELTEIQRADAEFLEQIASSDAVLVQAALYAASEITEANWQQWYSDCAPIANRVRVGYALGTKDMLATERIDLSMHNGLRCIDLLVGMGWMDPEIPTDSAFKLSSFGTGHGKGAFWGTSIAAPLGLSVLAQYWQEGHKQYNSQSLAAAFRADSNGTPPIRDILEDHLFLNSRNDYVNNR
jgi:hypothetical protein